MTRREILKRIMLIRFMRTTWPWRVRNIGRIEYTRKVTRRPPRLTWTGIIWIDHNSCPKTLVYRWRWEENQPECKECQQLEADDVKHSSVHLLHIPDPCQSCPCNQFHLLMKCWRLMLMCWPLARCGRRAGPCQRSIASLLLLDAGQLLLLPVIPHQLAIVRHCPYLQSTW